MDIFILPLVMGISLLTPSAYRWYIYFKTKINTEASKTRNMQSNFVKYCNIESCFILENEIPNIIAFLVEKKKPQGWYNYFERHKTLVDNSNNLKRLFYCVESFLIVRISKLLIFLFVCFFLNEEVTRKFRSISKEEFIILWRLENGLLLSFCEIPWNTISVVFRRQ